MKRRISRSGALVVSLLALSPLARADAANPTDRARADALFDAAKQLMGRGQFFEACPKLEQARELDPKAGGTLLALGLCHEGEQRLATALHELREAQEMAARTANRERDALAAEHIAAIAPHVSRLVLHRGNSTALVRVDGGPPSSESSMDLDGGDHVARAVLSDGSLWEASFHLATKDDVRELTLPVPKEPAAPKGGSPPSDAAKASRTEETPAPSGLRTAGYILGTIGIAGTLTGAAFGIAALHAQSLANCPNDVCKMSSDVLHHQDAQRDAVITDVLLGAGIVAIATAPFLIWSPRSAAPHVAVAAIGSPQGAVVWCTGEF